MIEFNLEEKHQIFPMHEPLHTESKKEFQLERLVLFSDAVFAIAITLLIIEIKVPDPKNEVTEIAVVQGVVKLIPKFIGFILSFFLIGLYWTVHHRMFGFLVNYTRKLITLNMIFLLSIVLMPFSTAFYSDYLMPDRIRLITPLVFYVGNILFIGIMNFKLWGYIGNPKNNLAEGIPHGPFIKQAKIRSLAVPLIFCLMIPVAFFAPVQARYIPVLIPIVMKIIQRRFKNKIQPAHF